MTEPTRAQPAEEGGASQAAQMAAEAEGGARILQPWAATLVTAICLLWSGFQLHVAYVPTNSTLVRSAHLTFAMILAYLLFPARKSQRAGVPWYDVVLALLAGLGAFYNFANYQAIAERAGEILWWEVYVGALTVVLLLWAAWRSLGMALTIIGTVFLLYSLYGPYMPDMIAHRGASLSKLMNHQYLTTEGIFGVPLWVSATFVFLFVLFGALLEKAGGGFYFIQVAYSALGSFRGGPAKAAVLASGLTGLISGSSIANTVTTGTFTIPLMKRVGLPDYKAAAVEVAASTNGQLMPPVMGAAAFIIAEYLGIGYIDVVYAAFIPAVVSYIALFYIVHLEAVKLDIRGIARSELPPFWRTFASGLHYLLPVAILIYFLMVERLSPASSAFNAVVWLAVLMVIQHPARRLLLPMVGLPAPTLLPEPAPGWRRFAGPLPWLIPPAAGLYARALLHWGSEASIVAALVAAVLVLGLQRVVRAELAGRGHALGRGLMQGLAELCGGLVAGARNMIGIGIATAAAGIVVGTITLTGIGQVLTELIEVLSGGNLIAILMLTAFTSLILGMGLPTTANYIVMASLTAPVIVALAGKSGLAVPAIAAHLFVFYFGILADDTPPVGLAAYAAAAIARSDPIRTGIQGFAYDIRTGMLPFMFFFNTRMLLIDGVDASGAYVWVTNWLVVLLIFVASVMAMLAFVALVQGHFLVRNRWYEALGFAAIAWIMFRPGFMMELAGLPHLDQEWAYVIGFTGYGLIYLAQHARRRAALLIAT
jgi:TRAP transporter 4TM/12TM fusion protein